MVCRDRIFAFPAAPLRNPWIIFLPIALSLAIFSATAVHFGKQLSCLWRVVFITTLWAIWHARNMAIFDKVLPYVHHSLAFIIASVKEANDPVHGHMNGSVRGLLILDHFGIQGRSPPTNTTIIIRWKPPSAG
ncbi:hypothetical protein ACS0TY_006674 [Phlomoides rotata]